MRQVNYDMVLVSQSPASSMQGVEERTECGARLVKGAFQRTECPSSLPKAHSSNVDVFVPDLSSST